MGNSDLLNALQAHFSDPNITKTQTVQALWSGYGEIARYQSPKLNTSIIVKHIAPAKNTTHPRGWNTNNSHQRKLRSYEIETNFYRGYAEQCDQFCLVPKLLAEFSLQQQQVLVLEDLDSLGYSLRKSDGNLDDVALGVKWLAYFHARFTQGPQAVSAFPLKPAVENQEYSDLWPVGTYWHLATRTDEYSAMAESPLKQHAQQLDQYLNAAQFKTLVHGDAKLANFCFPDDPNLKSLAAVDFQYVGKGVGVKDLAYFLGASLSQDALFAYEINVLDSYFKHLKSALEHYQVNVSFDDLEAEWRNLYPIAWADFYRFLLGWSPEHYKINRYMQTQTDIALSTLNIDQKLD